MTSVIRRLAPLVLIVSLAPLGARAQTLDIRSIGGLELVTVVLPMADATTVAWVEADQNGQPVPRHKVASAVTASAELEAVLAGGADTAVPPVVVVCGTLRPDETAALVRALIDGRPVADVAESRRPRPAENTVDRRLAPPGSAARVRLRLPLPPWGAVTRPAAEVAADLLPRLVAAQIDGVRGTVGDRDVVLQLRTEGELAEHRLHRLRLAVSRVASAPEIEPAWVERSSTRLRVRRAVELASHPGGAEALVRCWLTGGAHAVRQRLFGLASVGPESVEAALREWFAVHPGAAELVLPPQVLNPRFAESPRRVVLDNGLTLALLERPAAPFAAACLRPILRPDISGSITATVLTRVALALRSVDEAPGWVRVQSDPPRLELGASVEEFPELCQVLAAALRRVADDQNEVVSDPGPRTRALQLMAGRLGLRVGGPLTPAELLRPENLVLGAVVDDAEVAADAALKFFAPVRATGAIATSGAVGSPLRRAVVGGDRSTVVVGLQRPVGVEEGVAELARSVLEARLRTAIGDGTVELHDVTTPSGQVLVLVLTAGRDLPSLESALRTVWPEVTAPVGEAELEGLRRPVSAQVAARTSGPAGRALLCTDIVAGASSWVPPSQRQMWLLQSGVEEVNAVIEPWGSWSELPTTAAGPVPAEDLAAPAH